MYVVFTFEKKKNRQAFFTAKPQSRHKPLRRAFAYIQLFCRKSSNSNPGGIGLRDTEHISDVGGRDAKASARPSNSAV